MSRPWTDAHRREAALALLDEARTLLLDGEEERARDAANEATAVLADARDHAGTSADHLRDVARDLGLSPRRILRRVDALATGRLVREIAHRAKRDHGAAQEYDARKDASEVAAMWRRQGQPGARVALVTRIRRAR